VDGGRLWARGGPVALGGRGISPWPGCGAAGFINDDDYAVTGVTRVCDPFGYVVCVRVGSAVQAVQADLRFLGVGETVVVPSIERQTGATIVYNCSVGGKLSVQATVSITGSPDVAEAAAGHVERVIRVRWLRLADLCVLQGSSFCLRVVV